MGSVRILDETPSESANWLPPAVLRRLKREEKVKDGVSVTLGDIHSGVFSAEVPCENFEVGRSEKRKIIFGLYTVPSSHLTHHVEKFQLFFCDLTLTERERRY